MPEQFQTYSRDNPGQVWRTYTYDMTDTADIAKYVARTRYAFPGGYELFAITDDGGVLCHKCCRTEFPQIATSYPGDGWRVVGCDSAANLDGPIYCDHCIKEIS